MHTLNSYYSQGTKLRNLMNNVILLLKSLHEVGDITKLLHT